MYKTGLFRVFHRWAANAGANDPHVPLTWTGPCEGLWPAKRDIIWQTVLSFFKSKQMHFTPLGAKNKTPVYKSRGLVEMSIQDALFCY
jgi:hypothetical protein